MHFVRNPSVSKLETVLGYLGESGITDPRIIAVLLFTADGLHMAEHGRTLYGEAWYRDSTSPGYAVRGFLLDAILGHLRRTDRHGRFERDTVSRSDLVALDRATETLASTGLHLHGDAARNQDRDAIIRAAKASPLWSEGPDDEPLDLLMPFEGRHGLAAREDCHTTARYRTY
jgi:hypothetical protein